MGELSRVAPIDKLSIVFVVILSVIFLHEPISLKTGLGILLITLGALVLAI